MEYLFNVKSCYIMAQANTGGKTDGMKKAMKFRVRKRENPEGKSVLSTIYARYILPTIYRTQQGRLIIARNNVNRISIAIGS
jgi:hypothetical protein